MIISREKIEVSTLNALIALILGIGAVFAIFYNAQASTAKNISDVSGRVGVVEQKSDDMEPRLKRIEDKIDNSATKDDLKSLNNKLDGVLTSLRRFPTY